ncbi:hypothetical protein TrLO_g8913 [Triparma laevis f. longispina]|uniref:Secreted protein n=1 Tax=Triparma laevis f. longispina TaxID=1714387 RepID=A0A9W7A6Q4_9STRA|nr:hypothetical protein TrLO_g8913 [Triparma laevis f. longispina]
MMRPCGHSMVMSLLVVAWRRILEVLVLAMPEEKKVRGKKKKQQRKKTDPRKLEIFDTCLALGRACKYVVLLGVLMMRGDT